MLQQLDRRMQWGNSDIFVCDTPGPVRRLLHTENPWMSTCTHDTPEASLLLALSCCLGLSIVFEPGTSSHLQFAKQVDPSR